MINALDHRKADYPVEPLFVSRWSPRAMSGEPITDGEILTLFEAARWAPSTYNEQEWRFLYARRDRPEWHRHFDLLVEGNQAWCKNAAMLVVIVAHKVFERNGKPTIQLPHWCSVACLTRDSSVRATSGSLTSSTTRVVPGSMRRSSTILKYSSRAMSVASSTYTR